MSVETIIDNEYATLMYQSDTKIVHHVFHKTVQGKVFRQILNTGLEIFQERQASKWLSDDRKNSALPDDDTRWAKENWFPQVLEAGWKHWALVLPREVKAVMNLKEFIDTYRPFGLSVMVFSEPNQAQFWLEKVKF